MYELYIANKNYSSWSLRPWVLMQELGIPFKEHLVPFGHPLWRDFRTVSPNGRVPCLIDGGLAVWDSLAIAEYLAERHPEVWPKERAARAYARSAAAEMHSGFAELRNRCSMSCGLRLALKEKPAVLERELARIDALWSDGLRRFGGPFLAGPAFTAADAFYAPVAFSLQSYGLAPESRESRAYVERLLARPAMRSWYDAAIAETTRDEPHEIEIAGMATIIEDLRARA